MIFITGLETVNSTLSIAATGTAPRFNLTVEARRRDPVPFRRW
jgi:hypothetical protein